MEWCPLLPRLISISAENTAYATEIWLTPRISKYSYNQEYTNIITSQQDHLPPVKEIPVYSKDLISYITLLDLDLKLTSHFFFFTPLYPLPSHPKHINAAPWTKSSDWTNYYIIVILDIFSTCISPSVVLQNAVPRPTGTITTWNSLEMQILKHHPGQKDVKLHGEFLSCPSRWADH